MSKNIQSGVPELTSNLEDYLEVIFLLEQEQKSARAKDIADRLGVQRASVTGALQSLSQKGLINYHPYSSVTLTELGLAMAEQIDHRHKVLTDFLGRFLQLPPEVAEANACRLEHHIDDQALERLIAFVRFVQHCPRTGPDWMQAFTRLCRESGKCMNCGPCIEQCLKTWQERQQTAPDSGGMQDTGLEPAEPE
ncbi:metal-dependent transcriptional regulator [Desulfovermiculus halophilus]|jgi:DtxR family Mn-dependent transcriptional regulator|uniref:metal-dependent transcriptional regulator n=1 Tax=Desulfovermiculus halophilus TaxID=339722 RepID=UPI00068872E1|nr:metal-dependent transcriptional regulator [Desulfovermiculus halophilus]